MKAFIFSLAIALFCLVMGAECQCADDHEDRQNCTDTGSYFSPFCYYIIVNARSIDPDAVVELFCSDCREEILDYLCDCHNVTNSSSPQEFIDLCMSLGSTSPPSTLTPPTNPPLTNPTLYPPPTAYSTSAPVPTAYHTSPSTNLNTHQTEAVTTLASSNPPTTSPDSHILTICGATLGGVGVVAIISILACFCCSGLCCSHCKATNRVSFNPHTSADKVTCAATCSYATSTHATGVNFRYYDDAASYIPGAVANNTECISLPPPPPYEAAVRYPLALDLELGHPMAVPESKV